MKSLSIKQPWLNLIISGEKTIETRKWKTSYRGDLLLCASKIPKIEPSGKALCVVNLVDCRVMNIYDEHDACCALYPNAYSWVLDNLRLIEPFDIKGKMMLFEIDDKLIKYINE